jgi:hypothetical protein
MIIRDRLYSGDGTADFGGFQEALHGKAEKIEGLTLFRAGITGAGFGTDHGAAEIPGKTEVLLKKFEAPLPFVRVGMDRIDIAAKDGNGEAPSFKGPADGPGITGAEGTGGGRTGKGLGQGKLDGCNSVSRNQAGQIPRREAAIIMGPDAYSYHAASINPFLKNVNIFLNFY